MCLLALRGVDKPTTTAIEECAMGYREFNMEAIIDAGREVFG